MEYKYKNPTFNQIFPNYVILESLIDTYQIINKPKFGMLVFYKLLHDQFRNYEYKWNSVTQCLEQTGVFLLTYLNDFVVKWDKCYNYEPTIDDITITSKTITTTDPQNLELNESDLDYITNSTKTYSNKLVLMDSIKLQQEFDKFTNLFAESLFVDIGGYE